MKKFDNNRVFLYLILLLLLTSCYKSTPNVSEEIDYQQKDELTSEIDGMVLVHIPSGSFVMGNNNEDAYYDETPEHEVYLDEFYIDKFEVTNRQYSLCVNAGKCSLPENKDYYNYKNYENHPVVYVDWEQAKTYCNWAERDLPTEAQWEKAARGTDKRIYPWGNEEPTENLTNYFYTLPQSPMKVGSFPDGKSPYGVMDMAGNVWEWVNDWYGDNYYSETKNYVKNPQGPIGGESHVSRGGAFQNPPWIIRTTTRMQYFLDPDFRDLGFRCALNIIEDIQTDSPDEESMENQDIPGFEQDTITNLPDEFGYYYLDNDKYWNIPMLMDIPKRMNDVSLIFESNHLPKIYYHSLEKDYIPDIYLFNLINNASIEFTFDSTEQQDFYEVGFPENLGQGFYCFNQAPIYDDLNNVSWCFVIVDPTKLVEEIDKKIYDEDLIEQLEVILPEEFSGTYIVNLENENNLIELPSVDPDLFSWENNNFDVTWERTFSSDDFLIISEEKPVILIRSEKIQFVGLQMSNYLFTLGFDTQWGQPNLIVDYVYPNSHSYELGIKEGDILVYKGDKKNEYFQGQLDEVAEFYLTNGTSSEVIQMKYDMFRWISTVKFSIEFMDDGYVRIVPEEKLVSGLYCLQDRNMETGELNFFSCFYVKNDLDT